MREFTVTIEVKRATAMDSEFTVVVMADDSQDAIDLAAEAVEKTFIRGDETIGAIDIAGHVPSIFEPHIVRMHEE
jgi:hypothetical protein